MSKGSLKHELNSEGFYPKHCGKVTNQTAKLKDVNHLINMIMLNVHFDYMQRYIKLWLNDINNYLERTLKFHYGLSKGFLALPPEQKNGEFVIIEHGLTADTQIKTIREMLLDERISTNEQLFQFLKDTYSICLITVTENAVLDSNGYRKNRPAEWKKAYEECGIQLVIEPGNK